MYWNTVLDGQSKIQVVKLSELYLLCDKITMILILGEFQISTHQRNTGSVPQNPNLEAYLAWFPCAFISVNKTDGA